MKFRMDTILRFWVDCSYDDRRCEKTKGARADLIAEILRGYERAGDAMRCLNDRGKIAWKASPSMLSRLADAECEVLDDLEDRP
jgi:hypothetical protein